MNFDVFHSELLAYERRSDRRHSRDAHVVLREKFIGLQVKGSSGFLQSKAFQ